MAVTLLHIPCVFRGCTGYCRVLRGSTVAAHLRWLEFVQLHGWLPTRAVLCTALGVARGGEGSASRQCIEPRGRRSSMEPAAMGSATTAYCAALPL